MKTLQELQPLIIQWAKDKDLIKLDNAPKQRLKLIEECGELASAILKNNKELQKDAIGDIFVVLVILAEQLHSGVDLKYQKRNILNVLFFTEKILSYSNETSLQLYFSIQYLTGLSESLNHDLTECANIAWNEIKDRKGKTVNGTFIKN